MRERIAVLGGGHGLAAVLRALRDTPPELTVIVTVADDGGSSGELRRRRGGPAVGDLRRSLIALAPDEEALARAFARQVTISRLGRHPLGNLVLQSLTDAFGDLETASAWLRGQLGVAGRVLPASAEPVLLVAETATGSIRGESSIGAAQTPIQRLRFVPECPQVPEAVLDSIEHADLVILAPGSLFTSVLAAAALPDVCAAIRRATGCVLWIGNLTQEPGETPDMNAIGHVTVLRDHDVRIDAVMYDPGAELRFAAEQLRAHGVLAIPCELRGPQPGVHDPVLLRVALQRLLEDNATAGAERQINGGSAAVA